MNKQILIATIIVSSASLQASADPAYSSNLLERYRKITRDHVQNVAEGKPCTTMALQSGIISASTALQLSRNAPKPQDLRNIAILHLSLSGCHETLKNLASVEKYFKRLIREFPDDATAADYLVLVNTLVTIATTTDDDETAVFYWKDSLFHLTKSMRELRSLTLTGLQLHLPYALKVQKHVKEQARKIVLADQLKYKFDAYVANVKLMLKEKENPVTTAPSPTSSTSSESKMQDDDNEKSS